MNHPTGRLRRPENSDDSDLAKIGFPLEEDAPTATESMWARPLGGGVFEVENSPFYAFDVSYGDKILATEAADGALEFARIVDRGGHSTYRIFLHERIGVNPRFLEYWQPIEELGATYEGADNHLLSIDVPPAADIYKLYSLLEKGKRDGVWDFEEAHVGHKLRKRE